MRKMSGIGWPSAVIPTAPTSEPRGAAHRQLGGDPAAERGADQMHPLQAKRFQEIEIEIDEIVDAIEPGWIIRLAKAGMLRGEHRETLRQFLQKRHPAGMAAGAVQKHQRRRASHGGSTTQQPDRRAGDGDHLGRVRH
jgi:hypothetical protein